MSESLYVDYRIKIVRKEIADLRDRLWNVRSRKDVSVKSAGLISENYSFEQITAFSSPTSQSVFGGLLGLRKGDVVTNMCVVVITAGAGTVPTLIKLGLIGIDGNVAAQTANVASSTAWTTPSNLVSVALTVPYTVPETGGYRPVFLKNGVFATTDVAIGKTANLVNGTIAAAWPGGFRRVGIYGASATDLPANGSALAATAGTANAYWFGVS